jgi:hypothetical protein
LYGANESDASHFLRFTLQKLLTRQAVLFSAIARSGKELAMEEQRQASAASKR